MFVLGKKIKEAKKKNKKKINDKITPKMFAVCFVHIKIYKLNETVISQ